ncbi:MAG TPA: glycosyltransferase [Candidatus Polarisedimenticolia bacterium]|nr:glycosyltransferase [Candidatus Polarisedimenticolia bacterium]
MTRVSVVIPAYNAARFLGEALDSVFAQRLEDPEVVVVDDGSTDGTASIARGYGRGVQVIVQPKSGSARARNAGLMATTAPLVAFLDADDLWTPDKTSLQVEVLEREPALSLVFSDTMSFREGGPDGRSYFEERGYDGRCRASSIFLYDMIMTSTVIVRRACLGVCGVFDESLPIGQDTDLWFRIALRYPFGVVSRPLVKRRFHGANTTSDHRLLARCVVEIWARYLEQVAAAEPEMRARLEDDFRLKRWDHSFAEGCSLLREGKSREARRRLGEAIGLAPFRARTYAFYLASMLAPGRRKNGTKRQA